MISWHKVGQFVTPKEDTPWNNHSSAEGDTSGPKFGDVLAIWMICESRYSGNGVGFKFAEFGLHKKFASDDFEPVYPQALDRLRGLLAPTLEEK